MNPNLSLALASVANTIVRKHKSYAALTDHLKGIDDAGDRPEHDAAQRDPPELVQLVGGLLLGLTPGQSAPAFGDR
jgi:hypothetical protein